MFYFLRNFRVIYFLILSGLVPACDSGSNSSGPADPDRTYKMIFVTAADFDGDLKSASTNAGGPSGNGIVAADHLCMNDSNYPGEGTYKAMIVDGANRVACTTANCGGGNAEHVDWVLAAEREYRRLDGETVIGTTNATQLFDFALENAFTSNVHNAWTGMLSNWTDRDYFCGDWDNTDTEGDYSTANSTMSNSVGNSWNFCGMGDMARLICVEQ